MTECQHSSVLRALQLSLQRMQNKSQTLSSFVAVMHNALVKVGRVM